MSYGKTAKTVGVGHQKMTSLKLEYIASIAGIWPLLEFQERYSTRKALVEEGRKMTCLSAFLLLGGEVGQAADDGMHAGKGRRQSGGGTAQGLNVGLSHR